MIVGPEKYMKKCIWENAIEEVLNDGIRYYSKNESVA